MRGLKGSAKERESTEGQGSESKSYRAGRTVASVMSQTETLERSKGNGKYSMRRSVQAKPHAHVIRCQAGGHKT